MPDTFDPTTVQLKLYNTASRKKEPLKPINDNHVLMYTCGPTVYDFAHIGNFRTYVFEDLLRRTIKLLGMSITHVMNITDVDDKTINGAIKQKVTLDEYTKPYVKAFFEDLDSLKIERAEKYPAATEYIAEMIEMIEGLIAKGMAYQGADKSVYYSISKFPNYGCLSHFKLDELQTGASDRVASDEYDKDNAADFVLWKAYDPKRDGEIYWESPFGKGRPGWHLECSAMAMKMLGETIDIHCGGVDNMFPHHENEIAQSEAYTGKTMSKMWMHSEHLIVDNKKMSKSLGNFYTLRNLLDKGYTGIQVRYLLLQTHYKTQLNFTLEGLEAAKHSVRRLDDFIVRMLNQKQEKNTGEVTPILRNALSRFAESLADDLNISSALAAVYDMIREVNSLYDEQKVGKGDAQEVIEVMKKFDSVLNVMTFETVDSGIPDFLKEALEKRNNARKEKNWAMADELRDLIHTNGYMIEDTPSGPTLKKAEV
ncbi:MAG: cysteine--tRNA ligase [Chlamydiota bacterium]|nr:cysteine--tRNA ligase [Chlamydiota bacterium]